MGDAVQLGVVRELGRTMYTFDGEFLGRSGPGRRELLRRVRSRPFAGMA